MGRAQFIVGDSQVPHPCRNFLPYHHRWRAPWVQRIGRAVPFNWIVKQRPVASRLRELQESLLNQMLVDWHRSGLARLHGTRRRRKQHRVDFTAPLDVSPAKISPARAPEYAQSHGTQRIAPSSVVRGSPVGDEARKIVAASSAVNACDSRCRTRRGSVTLTLSNGFVEIIRSSTAQLETVRAAVIQMSLTVRGPR